MTKNKDIKYDKLLIVDLEATCWRGRPPKGMRQEIIEIGIVALDLNTKEISKEKGIIVKPTDSSISWFCTELTSITKELIKKEGVSFEDSCKQLVNDYDSKNRAWGTWGKFDRTMFKKDCEHKKVDYPFSKNYIDLQKIFSNFVNSNNEEFSKREYGVKTALGYLELQFEGTEHRGVDDAYNTARITVEMIDFLELSLKGDLKKA